MSLVHLSWHMQALRLSRDMAQQELKELKELLRDWAGDDHRKAMAAREWLIEIAKDVRRV